MVSTSHSIAIFELIVYAAVAPFALVALVLHARRSSKNFMPWLFLNTFLLLQLVAGGLSVAASPSDPSTVGTIISQVGLSPLILCMEGVLVETVRPTTLESNFFFTRKVSLLFHLTVVLAAALVGVGASDLYGSHESTSDLKTGESLLKAGIIIFVVAWLYLMLITITTFRAWAALCQTRKLLVAVAIALPIIVVRLAYSLCSVFDSQDGTFNPMTGSTAAKVVMQILPVMIAAIILTLAGLCTKADQGEISGDRAQGVNVPMASKHAEYSHRQDV